MILLFFSFFYYYSNYYIKMKNFFDLRLCTKIYFLTKNEKCLVEIFIIVFDEKKNYFINIFSLLQ